MINGILLVHSVVHYHYYAVLCKHRVLHTGIPLQQPAHGCHSIVLSDADTKIQ